VYSLLFPGTEKLGSDREDRGFDNGESENEGLKHTVLGLGIANGIALQVR
jgi:hypothetical protein